MPFQIDILRTTTTTSRIAMRRYICGARFRFSAFMMCDEFAIETEKLKKQENAKTYPH